MQSSKASKLRQAWDGGYCEHSNITKEIHLGSTTGDFVCTRCGECGYGRDWVKREKETHNR